MRINAVGEIFNRREGSLGGSLRDQRLHGLFADILQSRQCIADRETAPGLFLDRKIRPAFVDGRLQDGHVQTLHVIDKNAELFRLVHIEAHGGCIKFVGMVGFQPGGLIGKQRIGRSMTFVETIAGKFVDQVKQFVGLVAVQAVFGGTCHESFALDIHFRLDFFAHGPAQQICFTERIASDDLRGLHDLFLIDENPVGFLQNVLQQGMRIGDFNTTVLAVSEERNIVHRTRSIEGNQSDNITKIGGLDRCQRPPHAFRFQLEHAHSVATLEQLENLVVFPAESVQIDLDPALGKQLDCLFQH